METPIGNLGNSQMNDDDSKLVDSILNDLNNSKQVQQEQPSHGTIPQDLSPEEHQAMLSQRQDDMMQQHMNNQMMQQQMMQENANMISNNNSNHILTSLQDNFKYIIVIVILSILLNIGPVDDLFKSAGTMFVQENGSLNIQAITIKGCLLGIIFFAFRYIIPE